MPLRRPLLGRKWKKRRVLEDYYPPFDRLLAKSSEMCRGQGFACSVIATDPWKSFEGHPSLYSGTPWGLLHKL